MFEVGDVIIYGRNGVCKVKKIDVLDNPNVDRKKLYYTLQPCYVKGNTIFTPVDNTKVIMRPVLTKKEVMQMIEEIQDIETLWIDDEKKRESAYKDAICKCDCRELVRIIKTIYTRKQTRLAEGKKVTNTDERYFKLAEESLYGEFAMALEMSKEETKDYVVMQVERLIEK